MSSEQLDASTNPHYHAHPDDPIALLGESDEQSRTIDRAEPASYVQAPPASSEDRARIAQLVEHLTFNLIHHILIGAHSSPKPLIFYRFLSILVA